MQNSTLSGSPAARPFQKSLSEFYLCSYLSNITELKKKQGKQIPQQTTGMERFCKSLQVFGYCCFQKEHKTPKDTMAWHISCKAKNWPWNGFSGYKISIHTAFLLFFREWEIFFPAWGFTIFTFQQPLKVIKCCSVPKAQEWRRKKRHCHNHLVLYSLLEGSRKTFLYKKIV